VKEIGLGGDTGQHAPVVNHNQMTNFMLQEEQVGFMDIGFRISGDWLGGNDLLDGLVRVERT